MPAPTGPIGPPDAGPPNSGYLLPPPHITSNAWDLPVGRAENPPPRTPTPTAPPARDVRQETPDGTVRPLDLTGTRTARRVDDKLLLESEALHKRMLIATAVHGSARSWRDRHRSWPALLLGLVVIVLIVAAIAVTHAFRTQSDINDEQRKELGITLTEQVSAPY